MTSDNKPKTRAQIEDKFKWDLSIIFKSEAEWETALLNLKSHIPAINDLRGKLAESAEKLALVFELNDKLEREIEKVSVYASHHSDEDTGNSKALEMKEKADAEQAKLKSETAWILPELMAIPQERLDELSVQPPMVPYKRALEVALRDKPHVLSAPEEKLLASAQDALESAHTTYTLLTNADMKFPVIKNDKGVDQQVTHGNFIPLMQSPNREVRKAAFEALYKTYFGVRNTIAACLSGTIKKDVLNASVRHFPSALCASLHGDSVSQEVYDSLIEAIHKTFPVFYEYVHLRRMCLKLDTLDMYDQYVRIVPNFHLEVSYEQAKDWVRAALKPLGATYLQNVERAFNERWVDVYENEGKRSGAYSGGCYDSPPYILLNHEETLDSAFTLVHEMGHSMHTFLSNKNQPHIYANYKIFVAEVASTVNELLLWNYLMSTTSDKQLKAYLLNHRCDDFKGTVFRQTMFAEFEKLLHSSVESGTPLTADLISAEYFKMNKLYYGPEVTPDDLIKMEWARIPHFHYNFYVYKYATSWCASEKICRDILNNKPGFVEKYLNFLSSGNTKDPLVLLAEMGVDLTKVSVIEEAIASFGDAIHQLSAILLPDQNTP